MEALSLLAREEGTLLPAHEDDGDLDSDIDYDFSYDDSFF